MTPRNPFLHWLGVEQSVSHTERLLSALGGFVGILAIFVFNRALVGDIGAALIVSSMGASAVLLYAVPHGALSQPWPVVGGHLLSAIIGVACQRWIGDPTLAAPLAVGLAIGAMHYLRCLHPPGGATALTAVIGGSPIHDLGYAYILTPIGVNILVLVAMAFVFNAPFRWRRYPVAWARTRPSTSPLSLRHEDFEAAVRQIDSFIDIDEDDLERIFTLAEEHARHRRGTGS